jgi:hypothetical protein
MKPEEKLVRAAMSLRGAAPAQWDEFIDALNERRIETDDACIEAPSDRLPWAQGRAHALRDLLRVLMNAPKLFVQYQQKAKP